jgi:hypothetical protein
MPPELDYNDDLIGSLYINEDAMDFESIPVVFVEGFMGPGKPAYWGPLEKIFVSSNNQKPKLKSRRCIFVAPGCGSSLHDRAIEIFYQIKGGRGIKDYQNNVSALRNYLFRFIFEICC